MKHATSGTYAAPTPAKIVQGHIAETVQGGADVDQRTQAEQAIGGAVRGHQDRVHVGVLCNPLELGHAADVRRVRPDHPYRLRLDQLLEVVARIDLFAGVDRRRGRERELAIRLWVDPRHVVAGQHVLEPHDVVFLDRARELDCVGQHPARPAVERRGYLVAGTLLPNRAFIDGHLVAHLAAEQLVRRNAGTFAGIMDLFGSGYGVVDDATSSPSCPSGQGSDLLFASALWKGRHTAALPGL